MKTGTAYHGIPRSFSSGIYYSIGDLQGICFLTKRYKLNA